MHPRAVFRYTDLTPNGSATRHVTLVRRSLMAIPLLAPAREGTASKMGGEKGNRKLDGMICWANLPHEVEHGSVLCQLGAGCLYRHSPSAVAECAIGAAISSLINCVTSSSIQERRAPNHAAPDHWVNLPHGFWTPRPLRPLAADRIIGFFEPISIVHGVGSLTWASVPQSNIRGYDRARDAVYQARLRGGP